MTAAALPELDVRAQITELRLYPVKSCAGEVLRDAVLTETGLDLDRAWMVVDREGDFVSQRELPRMALISTRLRQSDVVLRAPGMLALHLAIEAVEAKTRVRIWDDVVDAYDMGDLAAQWVTDFLVAGQPNVPTSLQRLRLVRFDPDFKRLSNQKWTGGVAAQTQFSDGYAVLVLSTATLAELNRRLQAAGHDAVGMDRFRPNIVLDGLDNPHDEDRLDELHIATPQGVARLKMVKPCARCPIPDVNPATGVRSPGVGDVLASYRANPVLDGAVTFGMNAIVIDGLDHVLSVGQPVAASLRF
jgi:uncharacterized protein